MSITLVATLRGAGVTGDQSDATFVSALGPAPGGGHPTSGNLSAGAATLVPASGQGPIDHIVLTVRPRLTGPPAVTSNYELTWTARGNTVMQSESAFGTGFADISVTLALAPDGLPWDWAAVNGLTALNATCAYALTGGESQQLELDVAEVSVAVYQPAMPALSIATVGGSATRAQGGDITASGLAGVAAVTVGGDLHLEAVEWVAGWGLP